MRSGFNQSLIEMYYICGLEGDWRQLVNEMSRLGIRLFNEYLQYVNVTLIINVGNLFVVFYGIKEI